MVFADCELCLVNSGFAYLYGVSMGKIVLHMEIASCALVYFVITLGISVVLGLNLFRCSGWEAHGIGEFSYMHPCYVQCDTL
jgi:hypothetical protein